MFNSTRRLSYRCFLLTLILFLFGSLSSVHKVVAQTPAVVLHVTDTIVDPGSGNTDIPVYIDNYYDEIIAFDLRFRINRTDLINFNVSVDTSGSVISGWEYLSVELFDIFNHDLRVKGIANQTQQPVTPPLDQQQGGLLFKLSVDVKTPPPLTPNRLAEILIVHDSPGDLILATDLGNRVIGIKSIIVEADSVCLRCTDWVIDSCANWIVVNEPPYDECFVSDTIETYLDTTEVVLMHGSVSLSPICENLRGNVNNDPLDLSNISDVTFLTNYLFGIPNGPTPLCLEEANVNGDNLEQVNISDLTYLIAYLFQIPSGPPPPACP